MDKQHWIIRIAAKLKNDGYDLTEIKAIKILSSCVAGKKLIDIYLENRMGVDIKYMEFKRLSNYE